MAYSLGDPYRTLRTVMRVNGIIVGLALGLLLLLTPPGWLSVWGVMVVGSIWPVRLAGALLFAFGALLLLAAQERTVGTSTMVAMAVANALTAIVLLLAYLQGELAALSLAGRIGLVIVFVVCLLGAISPIGYLQADYRAP